MKTISHLQMAEPHDSQSPHNSKIGLPVMDEPPREHEMRMERDDKYKCVRRSKISPTSLSLSLSLFKSCPPQPIPLVATTAKSTIISTLLPFPFSLPLVSVGPQLHPMAPRPPPQQFRHLLILLTRPTSLPPPRPALHSFHI